MEDGELIEFKSVPIASIRVESRHRKDLGDLTSLATSMKKLGLIHPVTVTPDGRLLAGGRRVAAAQQLGWGDIPARVVDTLEDATEALLIERDENTERKEMTASELVALGKALEAMERPKAGERQRAGQQRGRAKPPSSAVDDGFSSTEEEPPSMKRDSNHHSTTDKVVAEALGLSATQYFRMKALEKAVSDPTRTSEQRALAAEAVVNMNAGTETVSGAYKRVIENRPAAGREAAETPQVRHPPGRPPGRRPSRTDQAKVFEPEAGKLEGWRKTAEDVLSPGIHADLRDRLPSWLEAIESELKKTVKSVKALRAQVKESAL